MKYIWSILGMCLWCVSATASELDLYRGEPQDVPARIMLLVDTSGSMNFSLAGMDCRQVTNDDECVSKMEILKDTLARFIDPLNLAANAETRWPDHYSVGLARYASEFPRGAIILADVRPLGETNGNTTWRQTLASIVTDLPASGGTPLISSYLETIEFLQGGRAISGDSYNFSIPAAWENRQLYDYAKGMAPSLTCDRSNDHLVVLTDGVSDAENPQDRILGCAGGGCTTRIRDVLESRVGLPSDDLAICLNTGQTNPGANLESNTTIWSCAYALARSIVDKRNLDNISGIRTHTIAYNVGGSGTCESITAGSSVAAVNLCNWAKEGGGNSYVANDAEQLANAFKGLLGEFKFYDSFTATVPGVSVNQSNRFSFLDDLYYSVFKPSDRRVWYGNLKKYKLDYQNDAPVIVGENGSRIDANNDGFFDANATSFWFDASDYSPRTISADGDNVVLGGAALRIPTKTDRSLFTSLSNNLTLEINDANAPVVAAVMLPATFPDGDAQTATETKITEVVNWLRGDDALDTNNEWERVTLDLPEAQRQSAKSIRTLYGAPIHSSPVVVNYTSTTQSGTDARQPLEPERQDNLIFVSANDGKLYAVDAATGNEKLAFVPGAFLKRPSDASPSMIESYYDAARSNSPGDFIYGLDSTWTVWRQDVNGDGNITSSNSNDFVYLYGGMRRGGRNYYGLDMTEANDNNHMEQLFVLEGGVANSETTNIGQTWSEPVLGLIKYNGEAVVAMIVGGGYDPLYDSGTPGMNVTPQGAQLYIVAAHDRGDSIDAGDVLWWASSDGGTRPGNHHTIPQLTDSIPSSVKVLDKDGDGFIDHIYVADLGGTLLRFDINNANEGDDLVSNADSVVVAELGKDAVSPLSDDDRRFFSPPSIALMKDSRGKHVAIAIGSGKITDPKDNTVDERYFFIKDYAPFGLTVAAADNPIFSYPLVMQSEKMLGSPLIVGGKAFFSTYYWGDNDGANADQCRPAYGRAALYIHDPVQGEVTQVGKAYPQSLAGTLTTILQTIPEQRNADDELISPEGSDFIGIGGTSAFDLPNVDMGNIRKTRWKQCPGPVTEICK